MKKKYKLIIFDFDGVLADTFDIFIASINNIFRKVGRREIKKNEIGKLKDLSIRDMFKYLEINPLEILIFANKVKQQMAEPINKIKIDSELKDKIKQVKNSHIEMGIITSNSKENVERFLNKNNLQIFDFILGNISAFNKHKSINKLVKKKKLNPEEVIMIGDEVRDVEAAKKSGIKIAAVTWGYDSEKLLMASSPNFIARKPEDLLKII